MPSLLPHDLCNGQSSSRWLPAVIYIGIYIQMYVYLCICMCCYSYIYPSICTYVCVLIQFCPTLTTPRTIAHQASLSTGFPRQEYWSGLLFPPPGYLPDRDGTHVSCIAGRFFTAEPPRSPRSFLNTDHCEVSSIWNCTLGKWEVKIFPFNFFPI